MVKFDTTIFYHIVLDISRDYQKFPDEKLHEKSAANLVYFAKFAARWKI